MNTNLLRAAVAACAVMGITATVTVSAVSPVTAGEAEPLVCDNTAETPATGTYSSVLVPEGGTCYLVGATVTGNVKAFDPRSVYIIDTEVQRNIKIRGATKNVVIGTEDCRFDPPVGNNVQVMWSHNVAICMMTVDNNITVSRNDGRIMVRDNIVGNNIRVTRNYEYDPLPGEGEHPLSEAIRVRGNTAGSHIFVRHNQDRPLILKNNTPEPITE